MKKEVANLIIRVFIAIWILLSLVILIFLLCSDGCVFENMKYIMQAATSLICSVCLEIYVVRCSSRSE